MRIGYIIICRYNSSRLPGKILRKIEGKEVLLYIVDRIKKVAPESQVIVATSVEKEDDKIADFCKKKSILYFRGSLDDVALRFLECAEKNKYHYATRINGDNIFVDINSLEAMTKIALTNKYDFVTNLKNRTFPKGMSIEMVKTDYYKSIFKKFNNSTHNEHVTLYLYENENENSNYYNYLNVEVPEASGIQLAIDNEEDFFMVSQIISKFAGDHTEYGLKEIIEIRKNILKNN